MCLIMLTPVAILSEAWVCSCSLTGIVGSNPTGAWISVSCEFCVLSVRCFCVSLTQRSPNVVCLSVILKSH